MSLSFSPLQEFFHWSNVPLELLENKLLIMLLLVGNTLLHQDRFHPQSIFGTFLLH